MICYKDMTFCVVSCGNSDCYRRLTQAVREAAIEFGLPTAQCEMKTDDCGWVEPEDEEDER